MFNPQKLSIRTQFLILALSIAVISCTLGLSAYLTDTDTYTATFHTVAGDELGFKITGDAFTNKSITPGDTITLNARAASEKNVALYIFVKITAPTDFTVNGLNDYYWHPISEGSDVYYYGDSNKLYSLGTENGPSAPVVDSITLTAEAKNDKSYGFSIAGYAIQADYIDAESSLPSDVYNMIVGEQS